MVFVMVALSIIFFLGGSTAAHVGKVDGDGTDLPTAVITKREMVVTANPLATDAGARILKLRGTAADAMVAVQTVLGLVKPQSSGLGGGAFVVYYDAKSGRTTTIDAREKAPAAVVEGGNPVDFINTWQSGLSVGVPGTPRMMEYMHDRYGKLPWKRLLGRAKRLARNGFELTEATSSLVALLLQLNPGCGDGERLFFRDPNAFEYFVNTGDCTPKPAKTIMRNKAYVDTLKALEQNGADAFYSGHIAQDIANSVQGDLNFPGVMTDEDLANYEVVEREPVCKDYLGYNVCGMGPPSCGGLAVGQILGIMKNRTDLMGSDPLDADTVHLFSQAGRLAFADCNKYVADSDFVPVPLVGMLDPVYLSERAKLITKTDMGTVLPGSPPGAIASYAPDLATKLTGTSHVSIIDRYGNALSMTSTIEAPFGNGVMVRGFLLNNELTDFSFVSKDEDGNLVANRVEPNKRPRSSMSPSIIFDGDRKVKLVTGSPGGSNIIGYTAQSIMNVIQFGLDPQEAINMPHYQNKNSETQLESPIPGVTLDYDADALAKELRIEYGYDDVTVGTMRSGLSSIQVVESESKKCSKSSKGEKCSKFSKSRGRSLGKKKKCNKMLLVGGADRRRDGAVGGK